MSTENLEARIKNLEELVKAQAAEITYLRDIEAIKKLQRSYGYYLEHWMTNEIVDLFSDGPDVSLTLYPGTYQGKAGVRRYFEHVTPNSEFLHQLMQLSGIVDINPDGKTAKGRWYGFGAIALPQGNKVTQNFMSGTYISDYVKEKGVWKFQKLQFDVSYSAKPAEGWVKPERLSTTSSRSAVTIFEADTPRTYDPRYPSGFIIPFHYRHPVTGRETSEKERNEALKTNKS